MTTTNSAGRGRDATRPWAIPARGWKDVVLRAWQEAGQDNVSLIASGVAFCGVLAMVPMLGAVVLSYGLVATPQTVIENVRSLTSVMPAEVARLIGEQLANIVTTSDGKKGFGLLIALGIALYGAMKGATAIITALNIAYDEEETRSFIKLNLLALAITAVGVLVAILAVFAITLMGSLGTMFPTIPAIVLIIGRVLPYLLMAGVGAAAAATLYRFAPNRQHARWEWLSPGSLFASLSWMLMTLGFGIYVANFGSYDATYGSLGAAVVLLTWLYLSAYVLLLGAEFNCELERQTARDTTTGAPQPMGTRGAFAADTVAGGAQATADTNAGQSTAPTDTASSPKAAAAGPAGIPSDLATSRGTDRALQMAGVGKAGLIPSVIATGGLACIGRRDRTAIGIAMLAAAAGLKWIAADKRPTKARASHKAASRS